MKSSHQMIVWTVFLTVIGTFLSLVIALSLSTVGGNDRAKIDRDRTIKIECIKSGKQVISGNCVNASK